MCPHGTQITINQLQILVISNDYVHKAQNQFLGKTKKLGKTKQLLKDAREQPIDLHKATMDDKTISKNLGDKVTAAGVIQKWKKYKTLCQPQSIQDLPSLGEDDHEKGDRSGRRWGRCSWDQKSPRTSLIAHNKSSHCLTRHIYRPILSLLVSN